MTWSRRQTLSQPGLVRPWQETEYCVVDVETTGLDLRRDDIVSFGAVLICDGRIHCDCVTYRQVRPRRPVSMGALRVHGLRDGDLDGEPHIDDVLDQLIDLLDGRVLVAHAAWVERSFLDRALRPGRRRLHSAVVDTAALLRAADCDRSPPGHEPDLEAASERLGLPIHTPHHALGDAFSSAQLLLVLIGRLERRLRRSLTAADLVDLTRRYTHLPG